MYVGRIVEVAETEALYSAPLHPYSEALLSAAPTPVPGAVSNRIILEREIADPANPPPGCAFHPRCRHAIARCREERPELKEVVPGRLVACLRARELTLRGVQRSVRRLTSRVISSHHLANYRQQGPFPTGICVRRIGRCVLACRAIRPAAWRGPFLHERTFCPWLQTSRPTSPSAFSGR